MSEQDEYLWAGYAVGNGGASSEAPAVTYATMPRQTVGNNPTSPDGVITPTPATDPKDPFPFPDAPSFPLSILETPKSRKRRLDKQRAKARRAKAS
jgi:hypothetical protein